MADTVRQKRFNVGLALLKFWMCFEVVMVHAWSLSTSSGVAPAGTGFIHLMRAYAVPVFMPLAFFFAAEKFAVHDGAWLRSRFVRLVLPFAFWSTLAFATWRVLSIWIPEFAMALVPPKVGAFWSPGCGGEPVPISFEYLGLQLLLGTTRTLGSQMWFQAVLIILTAFFAGFFRLVKPRFVTGGLVLLFAAAAMMEHAGLNRWLFEGFRYEVCNPLGRVVSMMPYAAVGLFLGARQSSLANLSGGARALGALLGIGVVAFLVNYPVFVDPPGFYYKGFKMLFVALGLIAAFHCLPFDRLPPGAVKAVQFLTRFTMGVYFVHILLGRLLEVLVFPHVGLRPQTFAAGVVVFVLSWIFCYALSFIPGKWTKALVQ